MWFYDPRTGHTIVDYFKVSQSSYLNNLFHIFLVSDHPFPTWTPLHPHLSNWNGIGIVYSRGPQEKYKLHPWTEAVLGNNKDTSLVPRLG